MNDWRNGTARFLICPHCGAERVTQGKGRIKCYRCERTFNAFRAKLLFEVEANNPEATRGMKAIKLRRAGFVFNDARGEWRRQEAEAKRE